MIIKLYPTPADFENISRLRTEICECANDFDFSKVVVNKPWGYEYLWYQNPSVAAWMLFLKQGDATSLHSHLRKRTSLIVVSGEVVCSTFDDRYKLQPADSIVLEPCVFHTTQAISREGAFVIEVETPPMKGDLVRLKDSFGREKIGYEQQSQYSRNFSAYEYKPFRKDKGKFLQTFGSLTFSLQSVQKRDEVVAVCENKLLIVPFLGRLISGKITLIETGEAANPTDLDLSILPPLFPPVELLIIDTSNPKL